MDQDLFAPKFSVAYVLGMLPGDGLPGRNAWRRTQAVVRDLRPSRSVLAAGAIAAAVLVPTLAPHGAPAVRSPHAAAVSAPARSDGDRASRGAARPPLVSQSRVVEVETFHQRGIATWYGPGFHGRRTANGEVFDTEAMTAAHRTLPFGTNLRVCKVTTQRCVSVRINDRGPFGRGRVVDLSRAAAEKLGMEHSGIARVTLSVTDRQVRTVQVAAPDDTPVQAGPASVSVVAAAASAAGSEGRPLAAAALLAALAAVLVVPAVRRTRPVAGSLATA